MDPQDHVGLISIMPAALAIVLAFMTRNTVFSLAVACFAGVIALGNGLMGFPTLLKETLGTTSFSWILLLELFIGTVIAFFQRTGAIQNFTAWVERRALTRVRVQLIAWLMGMFVFFSDYFSPLFVGSTMRGLTDRYRVSREKLAYIADSTSAPVSVLVPITGWAVFISGLLIGMGPIENATQAMGVFLHAIPFNLYAWLSVLVVGLVIIGVIPLFGPMRKAERRAQEEGKVLRDGAEPLIGEELTEIPAYEGARTSLLLNFFAPVLIVIGVAVGTFIVMGSAKTMEAFLAAAVFLGIVMRLQGIPFNDIMKTSISGMKGVMPAIIILALAYSLNQLSKDMGTANYIVEATSAWLTPSLLPAMTFLIASLIAFSTGTSWGTFAIMMPLAVPLAFNFSADAITPLVYVTVSAVAGGGVFGDHCSPLSDTSVLASTGAASDHIDHIKTQIPFALAVALLSLAAYLLIGITLT
ncbi:Na+/H+ antiporter NhaC family protein [Halomonas sp. HP20-15]|uniref:Na+/H+ antiporter NhaC family protein n=1 Tax=Halomonas sp. HP20-15 TaxID=3085901 RepID=UPI002981563F|nr:Na+/H+ antiporter NhaC family protein [Halomonas sp. HP20-15]MDW5377718.1 Na+/H+ antiporter NhaC family protein [Halomonas sp. HP20-15]